MVSFIKANGAYAFVSLSSINEIVFTAIFAIRSACTKERRYKRETLRGEGKGRRKKTGRGKGQAK